MPTSQVNSEPRASILRSRHRYRASVFEPPDQDYNIYFSQGPRRNGILEKKCLGKSKTMSNFGFHCEKLNLTPSTNHE